jgi:ribonuclease BN (tRNA processing enzyme)
MGESLTLVPVGVGAAYGRPNEVQSAYLVLAGSRALCLDLGAGCLNRLTSLAPPERLEALVVTHMHPDHLADLLALRVYMSFGPGRGSRVRVLGPSGLRERLIAFSGPDGWDEGLAFEALTPDGGEVDLGGGLLLRYAEVPHTPPTFAVRVDWGGKSICYGADCSPNDALPDLASGCDILLVECSFGAQEVPDGVLHLSSRDAAAIARAAGARRLLLTHCYPEFDRDTALAAAQEGLDVPVEWAVAGRAVVA